MYSNQIFMRSGLTMSFSVKRCCCSRVLYFLSVVLSNGLTGSADFRSLLVPV